MSHDSSIISSQLPCSIVTRVWELRLKKVMAQNSQSIDVGRAEAEVLLYQTYINLKASSDKEKEMDDIPRDIPHHQCIRIIKAWAFFHSR